MTVIYEEIETCQRCWGEGWVSVCWDDLCHSDEGCIHGDGNVDCPDCNGYGELIQGDERE